jgi:hypothetical protein
MYTTKGKSNKFPDHSDYVMTIQSLVEELKRPIAACWVKGHQDEDRAYNELSREAQLNIDVDNWPPNQIHP